MGYKYRNIVCAQGLVVFATYERNLYSGPSYIAECIKYNMCTMYSVHVHLKDWCALNVTNLQGHIRH